MPNIGFVRSTPAATFLIILVLACGSPIWVMPAAGASPNIPYRAIGVRYPRTAADIAEYEQWLGRPVDIVHVFLNEDSWASLLDGARSNCRLHSGQPYRLLVSLPLVIGSGTVRTASTGSYDKNLRNLGQLLVGCGQEDAIIRIGWEFNGNWNAWSARNDPAGWIKSWRRIVNQLRSVSGAKFAFDWTIGRGGGWEPEQAYPGDAYVDIIGLDLYDTTFKSTWSDPKKRWNDYLNGRDPYTIGLKWHRDFAAAHGKPMSFPEWGLSNRHVPSTNPDNPLFVQRMYDWIFSNNVAYMAYLERDRENYNYRLMLDHFPNASRKYIELFGSSSASGSNSPGTNRTTNGLIALYPLDERKGSVIKDESNRGQPLDLRIKDLSATMWLRGGLQIRGSTLIKSEGPANKIIDSVVASNEITVEAWVKPSSIMQVGPARVVTISGGNYHRNATLGQGNSGTNNRVFQMRLRTGKTSDQGQPSLSTSTGTVQYSLTHLVYTKNKAGLAKFFVNGKKVKEKFVGYTLGTWDRRFPLSLGNELSGDHPWRGTLYLVAFYDRDLSWAEVNANYAAGP